MVLLGREELLGQFRGVPGDAQGEHGTSLGGVGRGDPAAVDVGVLQGDREAEAAALGAGAGGAGLVEAVEDVREDVLGDAGAVVAHSDDDLVGRGAHRDPHRGAAVLQGVADQVGQDDVQAARVQTGVDAALGVQVHRVQPRPRVDARGDLVGQVHVVQHQPGRARVEAGHLHEVLDKAVEAARLADHQAHGGLDHRVHRPGLRLQLLLQDLRHGGDRGERRTQFVAHVRDEPARRVVARGHVVDPFLQCLGRVVERP